MITDLKNRRGASAAVGLARSHGDWRRAEYTERGSKEIQVI